ncbi:MAG: hypothetical protein WCN81_11650 [Actinomycetes bacterium]
MIFELSERGLYRVEAARNESVWLLSCEPAFQAGSFDDCRYSPDLLPQGWSLLADVSPERLLPQYRNVERRDLPDIGLVGGLHLRERAYLDGFPPGVELHALESAVTITLDGRPLGQAQPHSTVRLNDVPLGSHRAAVGDLVTLEFETTTRGLRAETGSLAWDLGDPPLYRRGATPAGAAGRTPVGPFVRGAAIVGVEHRERPKPVLLRTNATVYVVAAGGTVETCARPQPPGWLRQVGLPEGSSRWRVPGGESAEWLVLLGARTCRVIRVGKGPVSPSEELADIIARAEDAAVTDLDGRSDDVALGEWDELRDACGGLNADG